MKLALALGSNPSRQQLARVVAELVEVLEAQGRELLELQVRVGLLEELVGLGPPRLGEPWNDGTFWSDRTGWLDG